VNVPGKISIIGGAGRVGSNAAYALQLGGIGSELVLVDVAAEVAQGEALDLLHGWAAVGGPHVTAGGYDAVAGSDLVIVTAGLRRKPDESRLQLIERNAALFRSIVKSVQEVELAAEAVLLVVANPVDVLTYLAATELGWEPKRTIGLGTALDTLRFLSLVAEALKLDPMLLSGYLLGEHGDSMVPIYSSLRYDGQPLSSVPGYSEDAVVGAFARTRTAGAECIRLKGGAGYAVGLAIRQVAEAILGNTGVALPVSTVQTSGDYAGCALSRPTRVGRAGWQEYVPLEMTEEERKGLAHSAGVLRETIAQVQ
jgi:L-lactate dehydrogenase